MSQDKAPVLRSDSGLLRGLGLFETMRAYHGGIVYFKRHIKRIGNSAKRLHLNFSYGQAKIKKIVDRLLEINSLSDACLRLSLWNTGASQEIFITAEEYRPASYKKYRQGFSADFAQLAQNDYFLAQHKTTSRFIYEVNFSQAKKRGFDEAIMLNQNGYITEATRSNVFLVKNNILFTPELDCGCLAGITRSAVIDLAAFCKIKFREGKFTLKDLLAADEAFLTNSLIGIMPLTCLGKKYINGKRTLTGFLSDKYRKLLREA